MSWYRWDGDDLVLRLRVQPRASCDEFAEALGDQVKVRVTAPPVEGKANAHLVRFLAKTFGVPKAQVSLESGVSSRNKQFRIVAPRTLPPAVARR
jgi:uncharacterized protein (TIGR00251 family)